MLSFREGQDIINRELANLPFASDPSELYDPISYIISIGGKRLRPVLVLMSCNLFAEDFRAAIKPAIGIELFHNFTLLHDDIMDGSVIRRNMPTVHHKWNKNIAILSGDAMSIMSHKLISDCDEHVLKPVLDLFNRTALQVCEGQQFDMNFENQDHVSTEEYLKMIELKTAVLIAASMGIGAILGYATDTQAGQVYQFGKNLGMAFQIRDDYLDVYGEPGIFGKKIGQDILANKKTCLLIRSMELAGGTQKKELLKWLTVKEFDPEKKIASVRKIYDLLGIEQLTLSTMHEYCRSALLDLECLEIQENKKTEFRQMVDTIFEV
jgi:geranylgeranyl diphosphate synthase type II